MSGTPKLPSMLTPGPVSYLGDMEIDTNVLDPIVSHPEFARFVLPSRGFLDVGSVLTFSVKVGADNVACLPIKTGAAAAISSCILKIGNKTIAITDRYGTYSTIRRAFKTPEEKSQKDMVHIGSCDVLCPNNGQTGEYQLRDCDYAVEPADIDRTVGMPLPQFMLTTSSTDCPVWSIKLSEMFPALRNLTLPLAYIDQQCSIEIVWNKQLTGVDSLGKMVVYEDGHGGPTTAEVDSYNVKFLADYITYDEERMEATARQIMSTEGWSTPYEDVVSVSTNFPGLGQDPIVPTESRVSRDLGFSGMRLRSILGHYHNPARNAGLLGQYSSDAYQYPNQFNIRVNDKLVYPENISSESQKAHQLSQVFGTDICIANCEYSLDQICDKELAARALSNPMVADATLLGVDQRESLQGSQNYMGVDFTVDGMSDARNGILVGYKPVQCLNLLTNTAIDFMGRETTYFGLVERFMTIRDGTVTVSS